MFIKQVSQFSFNNEVCRLKQANCEIQSLINSIIYHNGRALNGEIKRLDDVSTKISDIKHNIEEINIIPIGNKNDGRGQRFHR